MSRRSLDIYAERARTIADDTLASGRRPIDRGVMPAILGDILGRLALGPNDTLLDIGAWIGMLTMPLSYFVLGVTAVDHADVLARMVDRPNVEKLPGDFLALDFGERRYTRALAYAMVHYLGSHEDVIALVDKAVGLLADGGLFLLGDVPNDSYRMRAVGTAAGQRLVLDIGVRMVAAEQERKGIESVLVEPPDIGLPDFADDTLLGIVAHVRKMGHNAWVLRQSPSLPFAHAREDILIQKLEPTLVRDLFVVQLGDGTNSRHVGLSMREAHPADCDITYAWSQDPTTRAASIRTETFTIEQHRSWFARKMEEVVAGDVRWYVLEEAARMPIGIVRYERVAKGRSKWTGGSVAVEDAGTELSITLAPQARGLGLAPVMLHRSEQHARKTMPGPFIALIRPENTASIRAFTAAGYARVGEEERMGVVLERWEKV